MFCFRLWELSHLASFYTGRSVMAGGDPEVSGVPQGTVSGPLWVPLWKSETGMRYGTYLRRLNDPREGEGHKREGGVRHTREERENSRNRPVLRVRRCDEVHLHRLCPARSAFCVFAARRRCVQGNRTGSVLTVWTYVHF